MLEAFQRWLDLHGVMIPRNDEIALDFSEDLAAAALCIATNESYYLKRATLQPDCSAPFGTP